ncbi:glucose 1-dehydrogenase [Nitrosovibrio sp. Nv17]|uniref:glucose 1-dehydrogenase n=1 Tax=Nitrosovibrio sp. Nv17 TaxID=1855339 RepID=UPI000908E033|nr:glucose 1-dehydrogenase [Nitrosovibrio sp. Nv17]SFW14252.1 3-oxoacyl-[acyl-carrier protein] reductase [Nitrosovibrio sp. Nv17]
MEPSLTGKVALVTGAGRGIGAGIARTLAGAGAKVVVNYLAGRERAEAVCAAIRKAGGEALPVAADVSRSTDVRRLFDTTLAHHGRVDILVNNAGLLVSRSLAEISDADFDRILDVNVKGVFYALREASTRLADGGRVVSLSSTVTRLMLPNYGAYAATKGAVEQMTRIFAREQGGRGITANIVSPGPVNTDMFNAGKSEETIRRMAELSFAGRIGEPADIATVVLFLASDAAGWVTGQNISASGGVA